MLNAWCDASGKRKEMARVEPSVKSADETLLEGLKADEQKSSACLEVQSSVLAGYIFRIDVRPRTRSPAFHLSTFQPSSTRAFLTAGPSTPTPFTECFPRPVTTFNGRAGVGGVSASTFLAI